MGIKTVCHPPYSRDLAPCNFCLFPKFRGCHYETIEEMKEAVIKVIDMLTQEDFHGAFQKLLERYNKCIAVRGDYFEGDKSFMCVLSIKVPIRKKSGNLFNDPHNINVFKCFSHKNKYEISSNIILWEFTVRPKREWLRAMKYIHTIPHINLLKKSPFLVGWKPVNNLLYE